MQVAVLQGMAKRWAVGGNGISPQLGLPLRVVLPNNSVRACLDTRDTLGLYLEAAQLRQSDSPVNPQTPYWIGIHTNDGYHPAFPRATNRTLRPTCGDPTPAADPCSLGTLPRFADRGVRLGK